MPGLLHGAEQDRIVCTIEAAIQREYKRGLEQGFGVAEIAIIWLRSTRAASARPAYTHEKIAEMIEARLKQIREREGL